MADEHWGRYKAICVSIGIAIIGHVVLVVSAVPAVITNTNAAMGTFMTGIVIMGLGTGGFKPNISTLIVEQIPVTTLIVKTLPSGERVASIGTAGVPGAGVVMLSMVLEQVGLPLEGIALVLSVDRIVDMLRTVVNVTGNAATTIIMSNSEKELDLEVYNSK